jgi:hypothetical protein
MCKVCRKKKDAGGTHAEEPYSRATGLQESELDHKKELVEKQLSAFGFEVTKTFAARLDYDPITYLNDVHPENRAEHEHFLDKFQDGIYAIATPSKQTQHALLQVLYNEKERVILEIHRPVKVLIGFGKTKESAEKEKKSKKKEAKEAAKKKQEKSSEKAAEKAPVKKPTKKEKKNELESTGEDHGLTESNLIVYVPNCYLAHLIDSQLETKDLIKKKQDSVRAMFEHDKFYREYTEKYLDNLFLNSNINLRDVALNGNLIDKNIPEKVMEAIRLDKLNVNGEPNFFPIGEYIAHRQQIKLPNGQDKYLILRVITKLNDSKTRTYREKNLKMTEVKEFYSIIYDLTLE